MAWRPDGALIEFVRRFAWPGGRSRLGNVTLPRCRDGPRLPAFDAGVYDVQDRSACTSTSFL
jgi:hypothetical protein